MFDGITRSLRRRLSAIGTGSRRRWRSWRERDAAVLDALAMRALEEFLASPRRLAIGTAGAGAPRVSVLVVTYNRAELTLECLLALAAVREPSFEMVLVDNASSDRTGELLGRIDGATVLRNDANLHFARGVNRAAAASRGELLLLLNNDAVLRPAAMAALVATLDEFPHAGAVGGRIVQRNGRLQEAGSIVFSDGSATGYGRDQDADAPDYGFVREVDYCSGACLMVRRELFEQVGGLDLRYQPAYYEDVDLCFALAGLGRPVLYQPAATVTHAEFASSSPERAAELCLQNQPVFAARWKERLRTAPSAATPMFALRRREQARAVT